MKKISHKHVTHLEFPRLEESDVIAKLSDTKSQVLEVLDCQSIENIFDVLVDPKFCKNINRSSIFVIITDCDAIITPGQLEILDKCIKRPFILQFYVSCLRTSHLYFKNEPNGKFGKVLISKEYRNDFDFSYLINAIHRSNTDSNYFNVHLLELSVETEKCEGNKRLIDWAVEHNDILSVKFLQLFDVNLMTLNDERKHVLEIAAENGSLECLKLLVGVDDSKSFLIFRFWDELNQTSSSGKNLLMIAAENGQKDFVNFLLEIGICAQTTTEEGDTASDLAWNMKGKEHYDVVISIICKGDGPFPKMFDESELRKANRKAYDSYKKHRSRMEKFRKYIYSHNLYKISLFVEDNPSVRHGYCPLNESILSYTLENRQLDVYASLLSKGFTNGIDENFHNILCGLVVDDKKEISRLTKKNVCPSSRKHIMDLMSKSRLGPGGSQGHFEIIQKYFETLDAIEKIRPILKLVARDRKAQIIFNFSHDSISAVDPRCYNDASEQVFGRTNKKSGLIMISALRDDSLVLGTLAHELTHFAMHLTYGNGFLPYEFYDKDRENRYLAALEHCARNENLHATIRNVFSLNCDHVDILKELIVCVPQLMAQHSNDEKLLDELLWQSEPLFIFFDDVLVDVKKSIEVFEFKREIQAINKLAEVFSKEKDESFVFSDGNKNAFDKIMNEARKINERNGKNAVDEKMKTAHEKLVMVTSSTPKLVLLNFIQFLDVATATTRNIFINLDHLMNTKYAESIQKCHRSAMKPNLFVLHAEDNKRKFIDKKLFSQFKNRVILITFSDLKPLEPFVCQGSFDYKLPDLAEESQNKILNRTVKFQGRSVSLSELFSGDTTFIRKTPLAEILSLEFAEIINNLVPKMPKLCINRSLKLTTVVLSENSAIDLILNKKCVVLADEAGMGKSTWAIHLANKIIAKYPAKWVVYVDLKKHVRNYRPDNVSADVSIDSLFFVATLFHENSSVEKKLFLHFFKSGKAVFFLDGFDEISPKYKNFVLGMVTAIVASGNGLCLTTRKFLCDEIRVNVETVTLSLVGLTPGECELFLTEYWKVVHEGVCKQDAEKKAKLLLNSYGNVSIFENPLNLLMLAMTHSDPMMLKDKTELNVNMFSLFDHFLRTKLDILLKEKGELATDDQMEMIMRCQNVVSLHHKMALRHLMDGKAASMLDGEHSEEKDRNLVSRVGMLQIFEPDEIKFNHQAYAEYFVADFIVRSFTKQSSETFQLFLEVLIDERYEGIRNFLDQKLSCKETSDPVGLAEKLRDFLICTENHSFLPVLINEKRYALLEFLLVTLKYDANIKLQNIFNSILHENLFQKTFYRDVAAFSALWACIEGFTGSECQKQILLRYADQWKLVLNNVVQANNEDVVAFVKGLSARIFPNL